MTRGRSAAIGAAILAVAVASVALAASERAVRSHSFDLPDINGEATESQDCPEHLRATGGGYSMVPSTQTVYGVGMKVGVPVRRAWKLRLYRVDEAAEEALVWAVCVRSEHISVERVSVPFSGQNAQGTAKCSGKRKLVGGGATIQGQGRADLERTHPVGPRRWRANAFAIDGTDKTLTITAVCERKPGKVVIRKRAGALQPFPRAAAARRGALGRVKVRPKCPAGTRPSAGGYLTTDDDYRVDVFRPQNRRWLFELRYYLGSPEVKAYAVCRPV